jgi:outer membrane protein assembly factor BamB
MKQRHVYSIKVMYKKWQYVIVGATFLALLVFSMNVGIAADWPRWRGPKGDGISTETDLDPTALLKGLQILWKATVGLGYSNVVIKDNHLYTMGILDRKTTVFCLSAETGKEIWRRVTESFGEPQSTPTIDEEFVYVLTRDGLLLCLKAKNGKVRWKLNIVDEYKVMCPWYGFAGSPVVEGDFLIITVNSWGIALDKKTGSLIWMSPPVDYKKGSFNQHRFPIRNPRHLQPKRQTACVHPQRVRALLGRSRHWKTKLVL